MVSVNERSSQVCAHRTGRARHFNRSGSNQTRHDRRIAEPRASASETPPLGPIGCFGFTSPWTTQCAPRRCVRERIQRRGDVGCRCASRVGTAPDNAKKISLVWNAAAPRRRPACSCILPRLRDGAAFRHRRVLATAAVPVRSAADEVTPGEHAQAASYAAASAAPGHAARRLRSTPPSYACASRHRQCARLELRAPLHTQINPWAHRRARCRKRRARERCPDRRAAPRPVSERIRFSRRSWIQKGGRPSLLPVSSRAHRSPIIDA